MENLSKFISESIQLNEANDSAVNYINDVKDHIDELILAICNETGIDKKKLKFDVDKDRGDAISLKSNDLSDCFGTLGPLMFKKINLVTWQGKLYERNGEKYIYFDLKWDFQFHGGGSNGTSALFNGVRFMVDENKWELGERLYK